MRIRLSALALAGLAMIFVLPAPASAQQTWSTITLERIELGAALAGYQVQRIMRGNAPAVLITATNGIRIVGVPSTCNDAGCINLELSAKFTAHSAYNPSTINAFNGRYLYPKAVYFSDGSATVYRMVVAASGVRPDQVAFEMQAFASGAQLLPQFVLGQISSFEDEVAALPVAVRSDSKMMQMLAGKPESARMEAEAVPEIAINPMP